MCKSDNCSCPPKEENCCKCPEKMDCCTPQFQRLDRLSTAWMLHAMGANMTSGDSINRSGDTDNNSDTNQSIAEDFVWAARALDIEKCKEDQVWGWTVTLSNGNLVLMQNMDGVSTSRSRLDLLGESSETLSVADRKAKKVLDRLYHMSEKALQCNKYPRTEGVMVLSTDCCNQKWLLVLNRATGRNSILADDSFVVVGVKL